MTRLAMQLDTTAPVRHHAPTSDAGHSDDMAFRADLASRHAAGALPIAPPPTAALADRLAAARAGCKHSARPFVMLFDRDWHPGLFRQIDALLDIEDWEEGNALPDADSFATLLTLMMTLRRWRRPGLGLTHAGHFVATWSRSATDRLIVECLPDGRLRWTATVPSAGSRISAAADRAIAPNALLATLAPFDPEHWLRA